MDISETTTSSGRLLFVGGAGSLAVGEVLLRTVPEVLGFGDNIVLSAFAVIASRVFLDASTVGWVFGWLLLLGVVFQLTPYLLPERFAPITAGLPFRLTLTAIVATVGIFVERLILESWVDAGNTPLDISIEVAGPVTVASVIVFSIVFSLPPLGRSLRLLAAPDATYVATDRVPLEMPLLMFGAHCTALAVLLGTVLAEVSLLYPLPELLVLGVIAHDEVLALVGSVNQLPARRDVAERISIGSVAVWHGLRSSISAMYLVGTLFFFIPYLLLNTTQLELVTQATARPLAVGFLALCLVPATVHVTLFCIRGLEQFAETRHRARVPGLLLPAGLLVGLLGLHRPADTLLVTPPTEIWLLAGGVASIAVLTAVRPEWFPSLPVPPRFVGPVAFGVFWSVGLGMAWDWDVRVLPIPGGLSEETARALLVAQDVAFLLLLCLASFFLLELLRLDLHTDDVEESLVGYALGPWGVFVITFLVYMVTMMTVYGYSEANGFQIPEQSPLMFAFGIALFVLFARAAYRTWIGLVELVKRTVAAITAVLSAVKGYFMQDV